MRVTKRAEPAISRDGGARPEEHPLDDRIFRELVDSSVVGMAIIQDRRFVYANSRFAAEFGYGRDEILRIPPRELVAAQDRPLVAELIEKRLNGAAGPADYRFRGRCKDGSEREFDVHGANMLLAGKPALISIVLDSDGSIASERTPAAGRIEGSSVNGGEFRGAIFRHLVEQSLVGITIIQDGRFVYANPGFADICGYSVEEIRRLGPRDIVVEQDFALVAEQMSRRLSGEVRQSNYTFRARRKDGAVRNLEVHGSRMTLGGRPALISIVVDITERARTEQELKALQVRLQNLAIHDPLTGLYNRLYLDDALERELLRSRRSGQPIGLVMAELDRFKRVNDTHGHLAGDRVLQEFAQLLSKYSRASDICCRFGGEEFLLILPEMSKDKAVERANRMREALAALEIRYGTSTLRVTASFGVASFPDDGSAADALVAAADNALYAAKAAGRNCVQASPARAAPG